MTAPSNIRQTVPPVTHPYARLYQAVILRAVHDLGQRQHRDEAREWLLSPESDYAFVTSGISPNGIRQTGGVEFVIQAWLLARRHRHGGNQAEALASR